MTHLGIQIHAHIHVTTLLKILATGITLFVVRGDKGVAGGRGEIKQPMGTEIASEAILRQEQQ